MLNRNNCEWRVQNRILTINEDEWLSQDANSIWVLSINAAVCSHACFLSPHYNLHYLTFFENIHLLLSSVEAPLTQAIILYGTFMCPCS